MLLAPSLCVQHPEPVAGRCVLEQLAAVTLGLYITQIAACSSLLAVRAAAAAAGEMVSLAGWEGDVRLGHDEGDAATLRWGRGVRPLLGTGSRRPPCCAPKAAVSEAVLHPLPFLRHAAGGWGQTCFAGAVTRGSGPGLSPLPHIPWACDTAWARRAVDASLPSACRCSQCLLPVPAVFPALSPHVASSLVCSL